MRRNFSTGSSQSSSKGCGIFIALILIFPFIGFFTNILTFIMDNKILTLFIIGFIYVIYLSFKEDYKDTGDE